MISTGDLRKGVTIEFEGQMCSVLDWQHVKMGRGGAIVRMKLRNLRTGSTFDRTCDAGEKFKRVYLDRSTVTYQYQDDDHYHFRSEEHTSELQSLTNLVCRLLLEKKKKTRTLT